MPDVEIEYCVTCNLLPQALEVAQDLLSHYGHRLSTLRLKTGSGGVFKVRLDDVLVWDEPMESFNVDVVRQNVEKQLGVTA